ncbi:MAG: LacI family transcriptional regulator [Chloroflexi bacterium CFX4]|nr:LacI family transcriptional regulator [Chloroflexi bacterium CFX4]MDL1922465.1 LacI family transcriptional regulator [Chloroflexi bacterium CFX3]
MPPVTIHDVAKHAGVGIGTVSRVLNGSTNVSPRTRERVMDAIRHLNYQPNSAARTLSRRLRRRTLGVLLPFFAYQPFVERLRGVQTALSALAPEDTLLLYHVGSPEQIESQIDLILDQRLIAALLVMTINLSAEQYARLTDAGIALAGIYDRPTDQMPCLAPQNAYGAQLAVQHLIALGHRRIAYIGDAFPDRYGFPTSQERYNGYCSALRAADVPLRPDYVRFGEHGQEVARQLGGELLNLPEPPTAIFAMSDMQALGVLAAARERHIAVPQQLSVIGFDDLEIAQYVGLTTIRQHMHQSGTLAIEMLLKLLAGDPTWQAIHLPLPELIVRSTTYSPTQE